jgi:hypothetical protein
VMVMGMIDDVADTEQKAAAGKHRIRKMVG